MSASPTKPLPAWMVGALSAGLLAFAAPSLLAQSATPSINRLPSALYLRGAISEDLPATLNSGPKQIRDLAGLLNGGTKPFVAAQTPATAASMAKAFVLKNAVELGIEGGASTFIPKDSRETLSGRYVSLEQQFNGVPIIDGHIQIKIANDGGIESIARNVVRIPVTKAGTVNKKAAIDETAAREIAWQDLGVTGELLEPPRVEKAYLNENNVLTMVYVVRLAVSKPFGYWEHHVDATTGRIVSRKDRRVQEQKRGHEVPALAMERPQSISSGDALLNLQKRQLAATAMAFVRKDGVLSNVSAMVFAPNPVSYLVDGTLNDEDGAERFEKSYVTVDLEGVRTLGGRAYLDGPLARIEDFEPGENGARREPSTSVNGWTARRGDNAFNDVMTYFHIHKNLMYLRKLGYTGTRDLFPNGIAVDTDGVDGEDNSHYVPSSDRLAFGHGCVDDNEDTDVILHELGHAIHYHVNPDWGGGDSGAIGEGFGDYWAVSYRMRMKNGLTIDPGKVFIWDGIDACWGGRRVDRVKARYEETRSYGAHQGLPNLVADELWSTPLVSALLELSNAGETPESVDMVVLEGMAGIGRGFTMRTLALKTVDTARQLLPGKPHAAVFEKHFKAHGIIR